MCFGEHGVLMSVNNLKKWIQACFQDDGNSLPGIFILRKKTADKQKKGPCLSLVTVLLLFAEMSSMTFFFSKPTNTTYMGQARFYWAAQLPTPSCSESGKRIC